VPARPVQHRAERVGRGAADGAGGIHRRPPAAVPLEGGELLGIFQYTCTNWRVIVVVSGLEAEAIC